MHVATCAYELTCLTHYTHGTPLRSDLRSSALCHGHGVALSTKTWPESLELPSQALEQLARLSELPTAQSRRRRAKENKGETSARG